MRSPSFPGRPRRALRASDLVRLVGVLSLVVALVRGPVDAALFLLVLGGLAVPRFLDVPVPLDAAYGLGLLVAAWSGSLDLYDRIGWLDLAVHFGTTALIAAVAYLAISRTGAVVAPRDLPHPSRRPARDGRGLGVVVLTSALGLGLSVLWELGEYLGNTYLDPTIHVGYVDTIGDVTVAGVGSAIAGGLLAAWGARAGDLVPEPVPDDVPPHRTAPSG